MNSAAIRPAPAVGRRHGVALSGMLALAIAAAVAVFWPRDPERIDAPTPLGLEQLSATSDNELMIVATAEVRWSIAGDADRQLRWRDLNPAARTVLALSWVESGYAEQWKAAFRGFASHLSHSSPSRPTLEDLALAYEAIGAPTVAAVCRSSSPLERQDPPPPATAFAEADRAFNAARATAGTLAKLRTYLRAHLADIVASRQTQP